MVMLEAGSAAFRPEQSRTQGNLWLLSWSPPPKRPTEARKEAGKANHWKILRQGNDHSEMGWRPRVAGRWDTPDPALKVNVSACPVHDSKQQFLGFGSVLLLQYFPSKEDTKVEALEGRDHQGGISIRGGAGWESERTPCHIRLPSGLVESYKRL